MLRGIESKLRQPAAKGTVMAVLDSFEILPHPLRSPTLVIGKSGNLVPVRTVRGNQDHCVVGSTPAERTRPRVEHSINALAFVSLEVFLIKFLLAAISVVTNKEVPLQGRIFRSEGVEGGDVVVLRQTVSFWVARAAALQFSRIATSFENEDRVSGFCQSRGDSSAARARSY